MRHFEFISSLATVDVHPRIHVPIGRSSTGSDPSVHGRECHALGKQGVIGPADRVELLEGLIVRKTNQLPPHSFAVQMLSRSLYANVPESFVVRCQLPVTLSASEPEPDFAIVTGTTDNYRQRHPFGDECRLLVEVADSSLARDLGKAAIYASAGVEEYWIIKIPTQSVLRMRKPAAGRYAEIVEFQRAESINFQLADLSFSLPLTEAFPA